jgi:hypothetical protein
MRRWGSPTRRYGRGLSPCGTRRSELHLRQRDVRDRGLNAECMGDDSCACYRLMNGRLRCDSRLSGHASTKPPAQIKRFQASSQDKLNRNFESRTFEKGRSKPMG